MTSLRRALVGKTTAATFVILGAAMATIPGFVLTYYPIALATFVRNSYAPGIEMGPIFYLIALLGVYVEAVVLAALFRVGHRGYKMVNERSDVA